MKLKTSIKTAAGALALLAAVTTYNVNAQDTATTTSVSTTTTAGTVSALDANTIAVTTSESTSPMSYRFSEQTTFVDETGAVVSREIIKSGVPVTVYYAGANDPTVTKVVVQKTTTAPAVIEQEKSSTTTTTTTSEE